MNSKELFLKALNFEPTPRVPVAILGGFTWIIKRDKTSYKNLFNAKDFGVSHVIKAYNDFGADNVNAISIVNFFMKYMGGEICYDKIGENFEVTKPPLKKLAEIKNYSVDTIMEKALADEEFLAGLKQVAELKKHYGDEKLIICDSWAPFTFAGMMVGIQNFLAQILDDEESAQVAIKFACELIERLAEKFIEYGADAFMIGDPVASGDMISPGMFEEFALPSIKMVAEKLDKKNIKYFLHICGNTIARVEPLLNSGIDLLSVDSIDLDKALSICRGNYTLAGDLNPYKVLQIKTPEEVYQHCVSRIKKAELSGGFVLMPGCDLAPNTPLENIQAMVKAAHDTK
ncbi:MAG: hypothetical protein ATN31_10330 [Candidatus Epulonipiscioides saccharophilum]|nr:MAG: hypothetical protein ATN31_10330 [Epulopiscium sp. AS2M-Bin001]